MNIAGLSRVAKSVRWANEFFEELGQMEKPKPNTDIDRRRKAINKRHNLRITKEEGETFFREIEKLGLGKLKSMHGPGAASTFKWASGFDYVAAFKELSMPNQSSPKAVGSPVTGVSILRLSSGQVLKLSSTDLHELKEALAIL